MKVISAVFFGIGVVAIVASLFQDEHDDDWRPPSGTFRPVKSESGQERAAEKPPIVQDAVPGAGGPPPAEEAVTDDSMAGRPRGERASPRLDDLVERMGQLPKWQLVDGMNGIMPKVNACYRRYRVRGTVTVYVVIEKGGKVSTAIAEGNFGDTPTGACVEKAVKTAYFPGSAGGLTISYPFELK